MSILTEHDWLLVFAVLDALGLAELEQPLDRRIHVTVHVGSLGMDISFVVDQSAWVNLFSVVMHGLVVRAVECLVAQTPHNHGGVVLVALHQISHSVNISLLPGRVISCELGRLWEGELLALLIVHMLWNILRPCHGIIKAMALQVRLVHDPKSQLIGQVEDLGVRWVVRTAKSVDIVGLHEKQVALNVVEGDSSSKVRVVLVSVYATQTDWCAIDSHEAIDELDFAETDVLSHTVWCPRARLQGELHNIEIWVLSSPLFGIGNGQRHIDLGRSVADVYRLCMDHLAAIFVLFQQLQLERCLIFAQNINSSIQCGILVFGIQIGSDKPVLDPGLGGKSKKVNVTVDPLVT